MLAEFLGRPSRWCGNPKPNFAVGYPANGTADILLSCPSGFEVGESAACCPCAGKSGTCCACAVAGGAAPGVAKIPAAGTSARFAGASFAVSRSAGLDTCVGGESGSSTATRCHSGFPKMTNNAMRAANAATVTKRPISASNPSAHHAGGSGMGSGLKDLIRRSRCSSSDQRPVDTEVLTDRSRSGVAGCSRDHLGAYLLSSGSGRHHSEHSQSPSYA